MESHLHRRSTGASGSPSGAERSGSRGAPATGSSPKRELPSLILLRAPDLNRPAPKPVATEPVVEEQEPTAAPTSALYQAAAPVDVEPLDEQPVANELVQPASQAKTWRSDSKHEPFRPEKYNSNLTTKLVAGSLSLGAVILVYFALFGGSGNDSKAQNEWDVAGVNERWTDDQGELEVDLGTEGEIGESSPLAPTFAGESQVRTSPVPFAAPLAKKSPPAEPQDIAPQAARAEQQRSMEPSLTDVLPWRREQALPEQTQTPAPGNSANAESFAPSETELPLNAPVTQAAQPQTGYANEQPAAGNYQPAGNASPSYPSTGFGSGQYPTTATPAVAYPTNAAPAPQYGEASAYQARNPNPRSEYNSLPATSGGQPWNVPPAGAPAGGNYPATSAPAGSYAPAASSPYGQPYGNDTPREWRR